MKKRILSILLTACLLVGLLPTVALAADNVSYLDATGTEQTCANATEVTGTDTAWSTGWYVATGEITIGSRVTVSGDVHLILADGCTLTVNGGIQVQDDDNDPNNGSPNALTIYAQSTGSSMGTLIAQGSSSNGDAAIGGNGDVNGGNGGTVTINGGTVTATSAYSAGIGGGSGDYAGGSGGTVTINGGTVTATGTGSGAGIGGGYGPDTGGSGGTVTINGGTVTATNTGGSGAGIGGGSGSYGGSGGSVTITGGTVTATNTLGGANIGGGIGIDKGGNTFISDGGTLIITGNFVTNLDPDTGLPVNYTGSNYIIPGAGNSLQVSGTVTLPVDLTIPEGVTLTIPTGASLTIPEGVTLTIAEGGTLTIETGATLTVNGTLTIEEGYGILVNNVLVTEANKNDVLGDGCVSYDPDTNTLTVNGYLATLNIAGNGSTDVVITGAEDSPAVGGLTITGAKDVTITAKGSQYAIKNDLNIVNTINCSGDVLIISESGAAVTIMGSFKITNARNVTISANYDRGPMIATISGYTEINCSGDVNISNTAGYCFAWPLEITSARNVTVTANHESPAIWSSAKITCSGDVEIVNNGTGTDSDAVADEFTFKQSENNGHGYTVKTGGSLSELTVLAEQEAGETFGPTRFDRSVRAVKIEPDAHTPGEWEYDSTEHWRSCTVCGEALDRAEHSDADKDHLCDTCKKTISECADNDNDHLCDVCGEVLSECTDNDHDHLCDTCGEVLSECADNDHDHNCDICGEVLSECADNDHDHLCDICGEVLSECADNDKDHLCDVCGKVLSECADNDKDHLCDVCGEVLSECADNNKDHLCDICGEVLSECADNDHDHLCDICGKKLTDHTGGTATCVSKAVCELCGAEYGETDPDHHADGCTLEWTFTETGHAQKYTLCGKVTSATEAHTFGLWTITQKPTADQDGEEERVCEVCGYRETKALPAADYPAFVDVPADSYYEDAVLWAVENGITQGTDATHFSPDGICTRAQAVTFLWRAAGSPAPKSSAMPFVDVKTGSYYYDAVLWAAENGITVGTSATTFSPDENCTRAHIVTFLWRLENCRASDTVNPFTDVKADDYYANAVLWAVKEDITKGTSETTFSPDDDCTRAQIVTFLWRCMK